MAEIRISQLTAKASNLAGTDEFAIAEDDGAGGYVSKKITGAELKGAFSLQFNTVTTFVLQEYTLVLSDSNKMVEIDATAGSITINIPLNSSVAFPIGTEILFSQKNTSDVTIKFPGGTLLAEGGKVVTVGQYAVGSLIKRDTDTWYVMGNLTT